VRIGDSYWLRTPVGKLHTDHDIPLHPRVKTLLAEWMAHRGEQPQTQLMFTDRGRQIHASRLDRAVRDAAAYRQAATTLEGTGMPGPQRGLLPMALLSVKIADGLPAPTEPAVDWGLLEPWVRPHLLLAEGRHDEAKVLLKALPDPDPDHFQEALWCLSGHAALLADDSDTMKRTLAALEPARDELADAGTGLLTLGPIAPLLDALEAASARK